MQPFLIFVFLICYFLVWQTVVCCFFFFCCSALQIEKHENDQRSRHEKQIEGSECNPKTMQVFYWKLSLACRTFKTPLCWSARSTRFINKLCGHFFATPGFRAMGYKISFSRDKDSHFKMVMHLLLSLPRRTRPRL